MSTEISHVRKPSVAMWLSSLCCGLGQIYCGRVGRGMTMYCVSMMFWPIMVAIVILGDMRVVGVGLGGLLLVLIAFCLWTARDAKAIAQSMAALDYEPQEYNRPLVYWLMILSWFPYAIGIALFIRSNAFEAFYLPTSSMSPSLVQGDRILVNKLKIETASFLRGDVVVLRNPGNRRHNFIKRIVGLPGETVEVRAGQLLINGSPLNRELIPVTDETPAMRVDGKQAYYEYTGDRRYTILVDNDGESKRNANGLTEQTVPLGSYFVLGDNRGQSRDSREFGTIPHADIIGKVFVNYYPGDTWKRFGSIR